jgi:RNA polymerase sigma-70 factor (ECF subfamily)
VRAAVDLERALCRIPEDLRLALILHDVEGYTHEEVATLLDIRPGTSKSRTSRAREHRRTLLRGDPPRTDTIPADSKHGEAT